MIRRHREEITTKTGNERWLVSYSDLVTLLFAFFVVMYSVSQVNSEKYRVLASTLSQTFAGEVPANVQAQQPLRESEAYNDTPPALDTAAIAHQLQNSLLQRLAAEDIAVRATQDWVEIDLNANLLFDSASAEPNAEARQIFADVAAVLAQLPNPVEVSGHTDDRPINNAQFASNWELSSARATAVVHLLATGGLDPRRLAAVGYGEFRPVAPNSDEQGRAQNRRVVLTVARYIEPPQVAPLATLTAASTLAEPSPAEPSAPTSPPSADAAGANDLPPAELAPVRLDHGGLLFSSDPELPRNGQ